MALFRLCLNLAIDEACLESSRIFMMKPFSQKGPITDIRMGSKHDVNLRRYGFRGNLGLLQL